MARKCSLPASEQSEAAWRQGSDGRAGVAGVRHDSSPSVRRRTLQLTAVTAMAVRK